MLLADDDASNTARDASVENTGTSEVHHNTVNSPSTSMPLVCVALSSASFYTLAAKGFFFL